MDFATNCDCIQWILMYDEYLKKALETHFYSNYFPGTLFWLVSILIFHSVKKIVLATTNC